MVRQYVSKRERSGWRAKDLRMIMGLPVRFWEKVVVEEVGHKTPCLLWTAHIASKGYGQFKLHGKYRQAHRVAYQAVHGPISEGLELDHLCRVRHCVNPDHLEPVIHRENLLRGNTIPARSCKRAVNRRYKARKRAA